MDLKVFVGYDTREDIAYQVCRHSILTRNPDVMVKPLKQQELRDEGWYTRPIDKLASTEFTFTRFPIPNLQTLMAGHYSCDSDIIFLTDIKELFDPADDKYAMCAHDYTPKEGVKMDGQNKLYTP